MKAHEGIQRFLAGLIQQGKMDIADLEKAINIAATESKTGAFKEAQKYYTMRHGRYYALGFAKGTRRLAALRHEAGQAEFDKACFDLRALAAMAAIRQEHGGFEWRLGSGEPVVDRSDSHILSQHWDVLPLLPEALSKISSQGREVIDEEVEMGRIVGETICVETSDDDEIVYAQRVGRDGLTRFVKSRQPQACSKVAVLLQRATSGVYVLMTAFVGQRAETEPWDKQFANEKSYEFWRRHALIWGYQETVPGTETTQCPWE